MSAFEIVSILKNEHNIDMSLSTFRRRLKELGFKNYAKTKKFMLKPNMIKKRKDWAKEVLEELSDDDWKNVAWSDESMIRYDPFYGATFYRRKNEALLDECVDKRVKHPMQVMTWGVINSRGVGELHFVQGNMDGDMYAELVDDVIAPQMTK